jgi:hypothetical protein
MKIIFVSFVALFSVSLYASEKMGVEAVEMYQVLSHHQVVECLRNAPNRMVNISIEKTVARCPGCNTYKISGNEVEIDIARPSKTVITIKGRAVPGTVGGFIQTFSCDIQE